MKKIWPGFKDLPHAKKFSFPHKPYSNLRQTFPDLSDKGFNLLNRLLAYDPNKRLTAKDAMKHAFFEEKPRALDKDLMPTYPEKFKKR